MSSAHFFTIASCNYLAQVAVLSNSLRATHPDIEFTVFLCDELDVPVPSALEGVDIVPVSALGLPLLSEMTSRYTILELNTAVKPFCILYLMAARSAQFVFYLDPDTLAVSRFSECFSLIEDGANVILTPHTTLPIEDDLHPNDFDMAKAGIYNLGFCGVSASSEGRRFVGWWARKLEADCRVDIANGIFVDQKWCDATPALFEGTAVLRHQGYNVGYWNLMHRPLHFAADGTLMAGNDAARLLHFSGTDMRMFNVVSKHQDRLFMSNVNKDTYDVLASYRFALSSNGYFALSKRQPTIGGYGHFSDLSFNDVYRKKLSALLSDYDLPPRLPAKTDFTTFSISHVADPASSLPLADFFYVVREMRDDLKSAFPDFKTRAGVTSFVEWIRESATRELPLGDFSREELLYSLLVLRMIILDRFDFGPSPNSLPKQFVEALRTVQWLSAESYFLILLSFFDRFHICAEPKEAPYPVPLALTVLHRARADLRASFDLSVEDSRHAYLNWAIGNFSAEYGGSDSFERFARRAFEHPADWLEADADLQPAHRFEPLSASAWMTAIQFGMRPRAGYPIFEPPTAPSVGGQVERRVPALIIEPLQQHVSLIGYPRAQMGMGEHVRNTAAALESLSEPFEIFDFDANLNCETGAREWDRHIRQQPTGRINILHINADETISADRIFGHSMFEGRYNIGYWAWELERFPAAWTPAIDLVDEIWAPSNFIATTLRQVTRKPVHVMPLRVERPQERHFRPGDYAIVGDAFNFVFYFDFNSYHQRKNPSGVVSAFLSAFPEREMIPARLLIKSIGADAHPAIARRFNDLAESDPRIFHLTETMSAEEMSGLLSFSNCFVSLHRSEGFGRGMAEAMAAGVPVIATGYGGNVDFMDESNSFLVDYRLRPIRAGEYVYGEGAYWAEPNLEHAAELMRFVHDNRRVAKQRAAKAKRSIAKGHSTKTVAAAISRRLEAIRGSLPRG